MAARAAHGNRRMDRLTLCLVFVALDALGTIGLRIERNRVNCGERARSQQRDEGNENQDVDTKKRTCDLLAEPDATGEQSHTASGGCVCTMVTVSQKKLLRVATRAQLTEQKKVERHVRARSEIYGHNYEPSNGPSATASSVKCPTEMPAGTLQKHFRYPSHGWVRIITSPL